MAIDCKNFVTRAIAVVTAATLFAGGAVAANLDSHPMRFEHLTLEQGLSQSNVLVTLQDSHGLIWLGTENGLNSYDGYEFKHYRRERGNPEALANDFIFDIKEDNNGNLWIATNGGGLSKLDRKSGKFSTWLSESDDAGLRSNVIRRLHIDAAGTIWIGTRDAGLQSFNPEAGKFEHFAVSGDAPAGTIFAFHESGPILWVGGDHGLTRLNRTDNTFQNFKHDADNAASLPGFSVRAIAAASDGDLWVGTFGGGLSRMSANDGKSAGQFVHYTHSADDSRTLTGNKVSSIYTDNAGRTWVGTTVGLNMVDGNGRVVRYTNDSRDGSSLGGNDVSSLFQDRAGLLWVGTKTQGVSTWNPKTWYYGLEPARELTADGASQPNIMSFAEDVDGTLWVATFGEGLNAVNRDTGEITRYFADASGKTRIADDRVMSLMRDSNGNIWAGTMTQGITVLNPATGESDIYSHDANDPASLSANGIMAMYEDRAGLVWVGTFGGGISRFNPDTRQFTRFAHSADNPYSLSSDRVTSFAQDDSGAMWVGTDAGGLNLFDPTTERFHRFNHDPRGPETLAADTVYDVTVDSDGNVWVGTQGGGLDRVVGDVTKPESITFSNVSQVDGLSNDVVYGVLQDANGWLWLSTNYGINRYNFETGEIRTLHRIDGLQSEEFNFGAHYVSDDGELFFGGHNGFNAFDPADVEKQTVVPLVALTGFFMNGDRTRSDVPVDATAGVDIGWRSNTVAFEFAAMDFAAPEMNRYKYKLEGFDSEWIDLGNRRRATYTDLGAGSYTLRVQAANSEGVWNDVGFAMPVRVQAAPWNTWWAYLAYLAIAAQIIAAAYLGYRRKVRREEVYTRRLECEVNARTEKLLDKNQQLRVLNKALQESSLSDPLTGLRNRRFVFEEVSRDLDVIRRRLEDEREGTDQSDVSELVFMMIDLDNFKPINDTYGHAAGDQMLLELRDVLLNICRRSDFVIRWGGDEFVVIAKQTKPDEAEALAERIRSSVGGHNFTLSDGQIVRTTCSIGFASYPLFKTKTDESSLDQIISLADGLMYEAKKERDAWVGMHGPNEAVTSFRCDEDAIESTSMLFRARRAGNLRTYDIDGDVLAPVAATRNAG